jgi:hypothetical protein
VLIWGIGLGDLRRWVKGYQVVNASRPGVIFCCGKTGHGEQIKRFNLKDVTGVGQVCLGSRFGRLGVLGFQVAFCYGHWETTLGGCLGKGNLGCGRLGASWGGLSFTGLGCGQS